MQLKEINEYGYYEIRLEAVGGLGANLCGKLLGELGAMYLNFYAQSFSSYGSEKRGSPVQSYIRYSKKEILSNSRIENPHILCLFHENLGKEESIKGVNENTTLIVNSKKKPFEIYEKMNVNVKKIVCIDAISLANQANARVNIILLGTIVKMSGFADLDMVTRLIKDFVGKKYPNSVDSNIKGVTLGFQEFEVYEPPKKRIEKKQVNNKSLWGYKNSLIGGINCAIGSSVSNDLSSSREGFIPLFIEERCIHCGLCDATCPDYVFQFEEVKIDGKTTMHNTGLNYHHCKGCLRCVQVCPTNALVTIEEEKLDVEKYTKKDIGVLVEEITYNEIGASSYITSESKNNIKNFKGGHF